MRLLLEYLFDRTSNDAPMKVEKFLRLIFFRTIFIRSELLNVRANYWTCAHITAFFEILICFIDEARRTMSRLCTISFFRVILVREKEAVSGACRGITCSAATAQWHYFVTLVSFRNFMSLSLRWKTVGRIVINDGALHSHN